MCGRPALTERRPGLTGCILLWTDVQSQREFLIDVETTWKQVLEQEDTDGDCKITVLDQGPKVGARGQLALL